MHSKIGMAIPHAGVVFTDSFKLDYTSRARWPEGLIVQKDSKKSGPQFSDKKSKTSLSDPILVTLDGVTNGKTQFLVTKSGRVTQKSNYF